MNPNRPHDDEQELRRRFEAWRGRESGHAPEFQRVWARAERAASSAPRRNPAAALRFVLGGAAMVAVVAGVWFAARPERGPGVNMAAGVEEWHAQLAALENELAAPAPAGWAAPTDYLLATTGDNENSAFITP